MTLYYHDPKTGSFKRIPEAWEMRWFTERLLWAIAGIALGFLWRSMQ